MDGGGHGGGHGGDGGPGGGPGRETSPDVKLTRCDEQAIDCMRPSGESKSSPNQTPTVKQIVPGPSPLPQDVPSAPPSRRMRVQQEPDGSVEVTGAGNPWKALPALEAPGTGRGVPDTTTAQRRARWAAVARFALPVLLGITLLNSYGGGLTLVRRWGDGAGRRYISSNSLWKRDTICVDARGHTTETQASYTPFSSSTRNTGILPPEEGATSGGPWSLMLDANAKAALNQTRQDAVTTLNGHAKREGEIPEPTGFVTAKASSAAAMPRSPGSSKSATHRFQFYYGGDPKREHHFSQVSPTEWQERYETGETVRFRILERTTVDGASGITAEKQDGTGLVVFIPDRGNRRMMLSFHFKGQQAWNDLDEMAHVE